jgi:single-strand DNA-binding protein
MSDQNSVNITGRLGRDPELRALKSGVLVVDVSVAVQNGWGEKESTAWLGVTFWAKSAEALAAHARKGTKIWISGRLDQESWEDRDDGKKKTKTKVTCERWGFCESKKATGQGQSQQGQATQQRGTPGAFGGNDSAGDEIPF